MATGTRAGEPDALCQGTLNFVLQTVGRPGDTEDHRQEREAGRPSGRSVGGDPHLVSALRKEGGGGDGVHFNVHSQWTEII